MPKEKVVDMNPADFEGVCNALVCPLGAKLDDMIMADERVVTRRDQLAISFAVLCGMMVSVAEEMGLDFSQVMKGVSIPMGVKVEEMMMSNSEEIH